MAKRRKKKSSSFRSFILITVAVFSIAVAYNYFVTRPRHNSITEIGELPEGFISHGIDISHYQGDINWSLFNSDKRIGFVYCKSTEGKTIIDQNWAAYSDALSNLDISFGAYHFFHPSVDPIEQAEHFLKHSKLNESHLSPVIDIETDEHHQDFIQSISKWLSHVQQKTGRQPIIYTSYHLYKTKLKEAFPSYQFWIANYSNRVDRFVNDSLIIHWQYSENGRVAGIDNTVDLNYSKIDFSRSE